MRKNKALAKEPYFFNQTFGLGINLKLSFNVTTFPPFSKAIRIKIPIMLHKLATPVCINAVTFLLL